MKWSSHIEAACSKAKRILGLLYRCFCGLADCRTIIQLYLSTVRPNLEYASSLWDHHTQKDIAALESVKKPACKLVAGALCSTLAERRTKLKLCQLYKILYSHPYFPQDFFVHLFHHYSTKSHQIILSQPLAHTKFIFIFIHTKIPFFCRTICPKSKYLLHITSIYYLNCIFVTILHLLLTLVLICGYVSY